mmetsp:Transcript_3301/g.4647  ORF Transcript_3301/g.4647 Transcript_3301/m.4647 type:complete len:625 (+) Transcript_3301:335-2209(+)
MMDLDSSSLFGVPGPLLVGFRKRFLIKYFLKHRNHRHIKEHLWQAFSSQIQDGSGNIAIGQAMDALMLLIPGICDRAIEVKSAAHKSQHEQFPFANLVTFFIDGPTQTIRPKVNDTQGYILVALEAASKAQEVLNQAVALQETILASVKEQKKKKQDNLGNLSPIEESADQTIAVAETKSQETVLISEQFYQMKLIRKEDFEAAGHIPRSNEQVTFISLEDLGEERRKKCFIIFVSHRWWAGETSEPHPDVPESIKFNILVKSFNQAQSLLGKEVQIYIWIDFFCIDQDDKDQQVLGIKSLVFYVAASDCLLTPFSDEIYEARPMPPFSGPLDNFWSDGWTKMFKSLSNGDKEYFGRAWCRLEIFLGSNAPLPKFGYNFFLQQNIQRDGRPHFLAGDDGTLKALPLLSNSFMKTMSPANGALTSEEDRKYIQMIMDEHQLQGLVEHGYFGESKDEKPHGIGLMVNEDGSRYEGEWKDGEMHGLGIKTKASGERYSGYWKNGKKEGFGVYTWVNGGRFEGLVQNDRRFQGIYQLPNGDRFEGQWLKNSMRSGQMIYSNGDRFQGSFKSPPGGKLFGKEGKGILHLVDETRIEGEWVDDLLHGDAMVTSSDGISNEEIWDHGAKIK